MKTLEVKLSKSYLSYIKYLIRTKQHLRNNLIIAYNTTKDIRFLRYDIIRSLVYEQNTKSILKDLQELRKLYPNIITTLISFNNLKNKLVEEIVKELNTNYKVTFKNLKNGNIDKFNIHAKKLSKINYGSILIPNEAILKYTNNIINLSIYSKLHTKNNKLSFYFKLPDKYNNIIIKTIYLVLKSSSAYAHITYEEPNKIYTPIKTKYEHFIGIDPGINNHLTIAIPRINKSYLVSYSSINRINSSTNYLTDKINSLENLSTIKKKYLRQYLYHKRDIVIRNELHKIAKRIIDLCYKAKITTIIVGYNKDIKHESNMSSKYNRKFHNIPHFMLYNILEYLCKDRNIKLVKQEESYSSKLYCRKDKVWKYKYGENKPTESHGLRGLSLHNKKITSLFKVKYNGLIIHADVNGAINIIQKYTQFRIKILSNSILCNPIKISNDFKFIKELNKLLNIA